MIQRSFRIAPPDCPQERFLGGAVHATLRCGVVAPGWPRFRHQKVGWRNHQWPVDQPKCWDIYPTNMVAKYYIDVYRYIDILRSHNVIYNYYVYIYVCV